ncbi:unnamed protein product [Linum tenue]|uniref:Uncharacterized protein n=1 Tax=Linum tenue TaxID=586396 RepID=A0AAV0Q1Y4_9ROSI|nr:unnamed protein product [Linum tenue]
MELRAGMRALCRGSDANVASRHRPIAQQQGDRRGLEDRVEGEGGSLDG